MFSISLVVSCSDKAGVVALPDSPKQPVNSVEECDSAVVAATTLTLEFIKKRETVSLLKLLELPCGISLKKSDEKGAVERTQLGVFAGPCSQVALTTDNARHDIPSEIMRVNCSPMNGNGAATGTLLHFTTRDGEIVVFESEYGGGMYSQANPEILTEHNRIALSTGVTLLVGPIADTECQFE